MDNERQYFCIRPVDITGRKEIKEDKEISKVVVDDWLFCRIENGVAPVSIAAKYLEGWGTAYYIGKEIGNGSVRYAAFQYGKYGVEEVDAETLSGGIDAVHEHVEQNGENTLITPPQNIPRGKLEEF